MLTSQLPLLGSLPDGFRALVIGASGGIGGAISSLVAREPHLGDLVTLSRRGDGIDIEDERSVAHHAAALDGKTLHLLICATGILTTDGKPPEKSLRQLEPETMLAQYRTNAVGPALIMKHFFPLLDRDHRSIAAFLSARVGSITDNRLGGWYSYRASKAALNQIVRTASIELKRTHPDAVVAAVHPGTVRTGLSDPYSKGHRSIDADQASVAIATTLDALTSDRTGCFVAYDGRGIDW